LNVVTRSREGSIEPGTRAIVAAGVAAAAALLCLSGCGRLLGPRATLGPGAIVRGRGLYNEVISDTNNQQTLELIVRARYGEPSGLLSVASVTANLRTMATTNSEFGIGPSKNFQGNIVPLSLGLAYEENPTIAYTPVQGERYAKSILSPVGLDLLVLLLGIEHPPRQLISILVKQVNGLQNRMYGPPQARTAFQRSARKFERRETLYRDFVDEASRLYVDAFEHDKTQLSNLVKEFALITQMRIVSSPKVVEGADKVARLILATYLAPNKTLGELEHTLESHMVDPLILFSEACHEELQQLGAA